MPRRPAAESRAIDARPRTTRNLLQVALSGSPSSRQTTPPRNGAPETHTANSRFRVRPESIDAQSVTASAPSHGPATRDQLERTQMIRVECSADACTCGVSRRRRGRSFTPEALCIVDSCDKRNNKRYHSLACHVQSRTS